MWHKIKAFFGLRQDSTDDETALVTNSEILSDTGDIKKILRKQGLALELFKREILEAIEANSPHSPADEETSRDILLMTEFADSFFYLGRTLAGGPETKSALTDTLDIVWTKLEALIRSFEMEIIGTAGAPFDPRLHEAVDCIASGGGACRVIEIVQPGYLHRGRVIRPARVVTGPNTIDQEKEL